MGDEPYFTSVTLVPFPGHRHYKQLIYDPKNNANDILTPEVQTIKAMTQILQDLQESFDLGEVTRAPNIVELLQELEISMNSLTDLVVARK